MLYYTWDFGDGPVLTIPLSNEVVHEFDKPGPYAIHVGVFETGDTVDLPIGSAVATLEVEASANYLMDLHKMKKFDLDFRVESDWINPLPGATNIFNWVHESWGELVWDGVYFFMQWEAYNGKETISGRVSQDGTTIEQLDIRYDFVHNTGVSHWQVIRVEGLPIRLNSSNYFEGIKYGEEVATYVSYFSSDQITDYH